MAVLICIAAVLLLVGAVDLLLNNGVVHRGVSVAGIDVGGMSKADAATAISEGLSGRISSDAVTIYASEAAESQISDTPADTSGADGTDSSDEIVTETVADGADAAVDEDDPQLSYWSITSGAVAASVDADALASDAYGIGRGLDFLPGRLKATFGGIEIPASLAFDDTLVSQIEGIINNVIGMQPVDAGISMASGSATTTAASDGNLVDDAALRSALSEAFVSGARTLVVPMSVAHYRIDDAQAASVAQTVNDAIAQPVRIVYNGTYWNLDSAALASCISTRIDTTDSGTATLVPYADPAKTQPAIAALLGDAVGVPAQNASFVVSDGQISITPSTDGTGPDTAKGAEEVEKVLFEGGNGSTDRSVTLEKVSVPAATTTAYLESLGITDLISSYTMQYWGSDAHNHNIVTLAALLNGRMVAPQSDWDFNATIGECNEANGFEAAGAIVNGVYTDEIGGGICFVATDLFNAVFEAGLPVVERHNHSLYIASYPDGRDATVSWPEPTFIFTNSTDNWMLIHAEWDESSVTVQLWGKDPGYEVTSDTGTWVPGEAYTTLRIDDPTLPKGTEQLTTNGVNGHSVTVSRTVAKDGQVVSQDTFTSVYNPQTEVIKVGTG